MSDDEEPVDMKEQIEERCGMKCTTEMKEYKACQERVAKDTTGEAHCTGQYLDFWKCVDRCAAKTIFAHLK